MFPDLVGDIFCQGFQVRDDFLMGLPGYGADVHQHPGLPGHHIELGGSRRRCLDNGGGEAGPAQMRVAAGSGGRLLFQPVQPVDQPGDGRCTVQPGKRHGAVAHAAGNQIAGTDSAFLGGTNHAVLWFADYRRGHLIGVALFDKISDPEHLIFLVAQHTADHRSGNFNRRVFQGFHCDQHGSQIAFGVIGSTTIHPAADNFSAKGVILPGRNIPRRDDVGVAFKHEYAVLRPLRPADNDVRPPGSNLIDLNLESLRFGPGRNFLSHSLFTGPGQRVPYRIDSDQIGG